MDDSSFPFMSVSGALPPQLLIAASHNGCRVKICFPSQFRVSGLQIIETNENHFV
jgi:hypothetical protein